MESKVCKNCNTEYPIDRFYIIKGKYRSPVCKTCFYKKQNNTEEKKKKQIESRNNWRRNIKAKLVQEFGAACTMCGYTGHAAAFDFHHRDAKEKEGQVATLGSYSKCLEEAKKCVLLCSNCHRTLHALNGGNKCEVSYGPNMKELKEI